MSSSRTSILREIAELSNPRHVDYDPEDIAPDYQDSDNDTDEQAATSGREHYVQVSKSQLKSTDVVVKDAKYRGKSANRRDLFNAETKFGDSTSDKLEDEQDTDDGSDIEERGESVDEDISGVSEMSNDSSHESNDSSSISADENDRDLDDEDQQTRRDKVRRLLAQETKSLAEQVSESTQADANKGKDIKTQQRFYDMLLDVRIRLQKALLALNSLPQGDKVGEFKTSDTIETLNTAMSKTYTLFAHSLQLRTQLVPNSSSEPLPLKRKFDEINVTDLVNTSKALNQESEPWRDETLTKWSDKVKAASGLPLNKKFKALNQSITHQLRENLSDKPHLLDRTRIKRAPFTILGHPTTLLDDKTLSTMSPHIFDDLDFYHPLLEELVERKALEWPIEMGWSRQTGPKAGKKNQGKDMRGSKGRKLRYHEHEKIQNFMAPVGAGTWHEEQIDELFASLLGRRIRVEENEMEEDGSGEVVDLKDGLRIYG